jgi:hypothetical protein
MSYIISRINGEFTFKSLSKNTSKDFADNLIRYLNFIYPLFEKAKEKSDFEFICTLLHVRGIQESLDTFENTITIFDSINQISKHRQV